MKSKFIILLIFSTLLLLSCKSSFKSFTKRTFQKSKVFDQNFTGFSLVDLENNKVIFEKNSNKYFQPASNNKLFTLYAGLKTIGDLVPALKYIKKGDSLVFWGTGDPSLLHPDLPKSNVIDFLKNRPEKLYFSSSNEVQNRFGSGWMLEDYNEYYQAEMTAFPIFGNCIRFTKTENQIKASPQTALLCVVEGDRGNQIIRNKNENCFQFFNKNNVDKSFQQDVPFINSNELTTNLLKGEINRTVIQIFEPISANFQTIYSIKSDSLYKRMLLVSDNMIAEQIILLSSKSDTLDTAKSIANILKTHLSDLPDKPRWVDGSGLSRYNLTTPRSLVHLLKKIYSEIPKERLYDIMPSKTEGIYAKSGSYSNNYNLCGYLIGKSGKTYAFSFMNNNFMKPTKEIRIEVDRILKDIQKEL